MGQRIFRVNLNRSCEQNKSRREVVPFRIDRAKVIERLLIIRVDLYGTFKRSSCSGIII